MSGVIALIELYYSVKYTESIISAGCYDNKESDGNEEIKTLNMFLSEIHTLKDL